MLEALQAQKSKMKPPTGGTVVKQQGIRSISSNAKCYLAISRSWKMLYHWVDQNVKLVLFTTSTIRSTFSYEDAHNYSLVEAFDDLDSFYVCSMRSFFLHYIELRVRSIGKQKNCTLLTIFMVYEII
jgi:hypothetical protein